MTTDNASISTQTWKTQLSNSREQLGFTQANSISGRITKVTGLVMEAVGLQLPVGSACTVHLQTGVTIDAEVVGFDGDRLFLMPQSDLDGVTPGAAVFPVESNDNDPSQPQRRNSDRSKHLPVGEELLGRVLDANGKPLDALGTLHYKKTATLGARIYNPLARALSKKNSTLV